MNLTLTIPMAKNLFRPMFGDSSSMGRFVGFFIRIWWVWLGGIMSTIMIVPNVILGLILLILPAVPFIYLILLLG
jgi:hypothetical protein